MKGFQTFGFLGLGLIGGSIARAIRSTRPEAKIYAYDLNTEALELAVSDGVITYACKSFDEFADCDLIFLCAPVQKNEENLDLLLNKLNPECIITDVGSVKTPIHEFAIRKNITKRFIGGHPMAGSERVGYVNSKALLLQNAYYIITPTADIDPEYIHAYEELVSSLGAIPMILDYKKHDYITAAVSHLPHVIAASLVNLVRTKDSEDELMKTIASGGFKDITRIASSSATMWEQICMTNTDNIKELLEQYIASLQEISNSLEAKRGSDIHTLFDEARTYRDSIPNNSRGPIKKHFLLMVDIADEPGALASIATILALNAISIKNIGIAHNREYEGGILRIEFYDADSVTKAGTILTQKGYNTNEPN